MENFDYSALLGALASMWIVIMVLSVFSIICNWCIYKKMCGKGWASIVPFYNNWVLCECTWGHGAMMFTYLIPFIGGIMALITMWKMYTGFGKGVGFKILSLIFPVITMAIVAFGKSEYTRP